MIIGFCGQKGSGKDTAADYLVAKYGFKKISFAAKLKESAAACWGINPEVWESLKNNIDAYVEIKIYNDQNHPQKVSSESVREFLQRYGTEAHRDIFGYDFWVDQALKDLERNKNYVITDVRFTNEAVAVHQLNGHVIQIVRDADVKDTHASEAGLPEPYIDGKISNRGSKEQLYVLLDTMLERLNA